MKSIILVIFFFSARERERISCAVPEADKSCESVKESNEYPSVEYQPTRDHLPDLPPHIWPKEVEEEYSCEAIIPKKKAPTIPAKIDYPSWFMQPNAATVEAPPPEVVSVKPEEPQSTPSEPVKPKALEPFLPTEILWNPIPSPHNETEIETTGKINPGVKLSAGKVSAFPTENATKSVEENKDKIKNENESRRDNSLENISNEQEASTAKIYETQETTTLRTTEGKQSIDSKVKKGKNNSETQGATNPKKIEENKDNTPTDGKNGEKSENQNSVEKTKTTEKAGDINKTHEITPPKATLGEVNNKDLYKIENSTEKNNLDEHTERKSEISESTTPKISQNDSNNKNESKVENLDNNSRNTGRTNENQESTTPNTTQENSTNKNEETAENTTPKPTKISDSNVETTTSKKSQKDSNNKSENKGGNLDDKNRNGNGDNVENTERKTQIQESTTPNTTKDNTINKNEESTKNNVEKQKEQNSSQKPSTETNANEKSLSDITKNEKKEDSNSGFGIDLLNGKNLPTGDDGGSWIGGVVKTAAVVGGTTKVAADVGVAAGTGLGTGLGSGVAGVAGGGGGGGGGGIAMAGGGGGGGGGGVASAGGGDGGDGEGSATLPKAGGSPQNPSRNGKTSGNNGRSGKEQTQQKSNSNKKENNSNKDKQKHDRKNEDDDIDFDLDEIDEDSFLDYSEFAVKQHTADNISRIFVEKIKRLDNTCNWFTTNFTNEINNLTNFQEYYDGMVAYAGQAPRRLGDKLDTEIDDDIYNRKLGTLDLADSLEDYFSSLRQNISTMISNLHSFRDYTVQLWEQSYGMQTEIVKEILSATSFTHHIYKDIGKARMIARVSKLRLIDCFSSSLSAYQNWLILMKDIYLKGITLERTTFIYLLGKYYKDMAKWDEANRSISTFLKVAKNHTKEVISKFINRRNNTEECIYNITTYVYHNRFKLLKTIKEHLIY